jgi:hypothetical protein
MRPGPLGENPDVSSRLVCPGANWRMLLTPLTLRAEADSVLADCRAGIAAIAARFNGAARALRCNVSLLRRRGRWLAARLRDNAGLLEAIADEPAVDDNRNILGAGLAHRGDGAA